MPASEVAQLCPTHKDVLRYMCSCSELICRDCQVSRAHAGHTCELVTEIADERKQALLALAAEVEGREPSVQAALGELTRCSEQLGQQRDAAAGAIADWCETVVAATRARAAVLLSQVRSAHGLAEKAYAGEREALETALQSMRSAGRLTRSALQHVAAADVLRLDVQMAGVLRQLRDQPLELSPSAEPNLRVRAGPVDAGQAVAAWGSVSNSSTCAARSLAEGGCLPSAGEGQQALVAGAEAAAVTLRTCDAQGRPRNEGGDEVRAVLTRGPGGEGAGAGVAEAKGGEAGEARAVGVQDRGDGSYLLAVAAPEAWAGEQTASLAVTVGGRPVGNSPFRLRVEFDAALSASALLRGGLVQTLVAWLPAVGGRRGRATLLYRASRDSFAASAFHRLCDAKGGTVTLVHVANGSLFGGYAGVAVVRFLCQVLVRCFVGGL